DNALDTLKDRVDWVTKAGYGEGAAEMIEALVATDLTELGEFQPRMPRIIREIRGSEIRPR
ncbi:MAG: hypothetical protein HY646_09830, partial [Acidobacteria bacterium]|nr:hypothetical protein [Acidobacteriota bacterium]